MCMTLVQNVKLLLCWLKKKLSWLWWLLANHLSWLFSRKPANTKHLKARHSTGGTRTVFAFSQSKQLNGFAFFPLGLSVCRRRASSDRVGLERIMQASCWAKAEPAANTTNTHTFHQLTAREPRRGGGRPRASGRISRCRAVPVTRRTHLTFQRWWRYQVPLR